MRLLMKKFCRLILLAVLAGATQAMAGWMPNHTVVVILENKSFQDFIGNPGAPWLNRLAAGSALMTRAYFAESPYGITPRGFRHPLPTRGSQVNYLYFLSGNDQGMRPDWFQQPNSPYKGKVLHDLYGEKLAAPLADTPRGVSNSMIPAAMRPFATPNLGAAILTRGLTYATFSESLPHPLFDEMAHNPPGAIDGYARRHNPGINWINFNGRPVAQERQRFLLPVESNLAMVNTVTPDGRKFPGFAVDAEGRPRGYEHLPTLSIVVPTNDTNAHTGSIAAADQWLATHIEPYARWAREHNSLLIIHTDEDGFTDLENGSGPADQAIGRMMGGKTVGYQYGTDRVLTLFYGPEGKVIPGSHEERIDHLNVLATLLERYGALETFHRDFVAVHVDAQPDARLAEEARREFANLRPLRDVFGEGPALPPLPYRK